MGISPENMGGDCFVQAVENAMADSSLLVCHGIVHGQGALEGIVFPHAWNEDNGIVIDTSNGHDIVMPVDAYYAIGRIDPADVRKYDNGQMMREVVRTGTYGPWDDMFDFDYRVVDDRKASRERTIIGNDMNRVARRALRKRAWTTPYDLDGFDMGRFVEEFDPVGTDVEQWGYDEGYSVRLEDRAHPGFSVWFDVKFDGYGEWECDWNQYIFSTNDSDDVFRKAFQDYYDESGYPWQFEKAEEAALDRISETYGLPNPRS